MSPANAAPLALTMGDPDGVGPEITNTAWKSLRGNSSFCFFVVGDPALYPNAKLIRTAADAKTVFPDHLPVLPVSVTVNKEHKAKVIIRSIETAVNLALQNQVSGVVTNPIAKSVLYEAGFKFPGHTEFLAALCKQAVAPYPPGPVMMLSGGGLNVALATIHISLAKVSPQLSIEGIINTARTLHGALVCDLGIQNPRIAVAGLNPHAGEDGALGQEETEIINVATRALRAEGMDISDARSADTLFHAEARTGYDAVIAMYHDQGLIPVKTLDFHGGVNTTLGLPIIRTSPDHGTAFDIAGKGIARADSLINAIKMARKMANARAQHVQT